MFIKLNNFTYGPALQKLIDDIVTGSLYVSDY